MRRGSTLLIGRGGVALPTIGDAFMGGFYAGIIDTTKGNIIATDAWQTGKRYALIVSPRSMEGSLYAWRQVNGTVAGARTRWDGLAFTESISGSLSSFPAAQYANTRTRPTDDASAWYLPALDEAELLYRNFKPTAEQNTSLNEGSGGFPGVQPSGTNPSSDPAASAYTFNDPARTGVTAFRSAEGSEYIALGKSVMTATEFNNLSVWVQNFANGGQSYVAKTGTHSGSVVVRPVRRLLL